MDDTPSPYEVHCASCKTSFPVGTRKCIHCGAKIRGPRAARTRTRLGRPEVDPGTVIQESMPPMSVSTSTSTSAQMPGSAGAEIDPEAFLEEGREEDEAENAGGPFRISLWSLSVGIALLGSVLRTCQGG